MAVQKPNWLLRFANPKNGMLDSHAMATLQQMATSANTSETNIAALQAAQKFTSEFISSQQTYSNGALVTTAHGLGSIPKSMQLTAVCQTAQLGYAIGDTIAVSASSVTLSADSTNLYAAVVTTGISTVNKSTFAAGTLTAANWKLVLSCWN